MTLSTPIRGVTAVPGPLIEGDSHRRELTGMYAILIATECIVELHQITAGTVTLACDNLSAINTAEEGYIPNVRQANFDFVQSIVKLIQASPLTWLPQHVKGHQDDGPRIHPLTLLERLNIHMDTLAKGYWSHIIRNSARIPPPFLSPLGRRMAGLERESKIHTALNR